MKVDKYGLKIKGIKQVSASTKDYDCCSGLYNELFYDTSTGEVWTILQISFGHNSWTEYHDPDIIKIGNYSRHLTMQDVVDEVYRELRYRRVFAE